MSANKFYITVRQSPQYHQMTLDEFLFQTEAVSAVVNTNQTNTRTYEVDRVSPRFALRIDPQKLIAVLERFNNTTQALHRENMQELYTNFYIPKHGGGFPALFQSFFKSQRRYVPCDSGTLCSGIAKLVNPMISQHPALMHEEIYEGCKQTVLAFLEENGFDISLVDFDGLLSSAFRKIDAPVPSLSMALTDLKTIFENDFGALYHTSAFAYVKGRSTVDAIKRHQENESKWFAKFDLKNFFGSTTPEFVMNMLSMVFPFSEVIKYRQGKELLYRALELAFLNNGLPQGTPLSPTLTNIMMIPVDFKIANTLRDYKRQRYVYTRYADDFQVSSKYTFSFQEIEKLIVDTLAGFGAPFTINSKKTRYGSSSGSNWNLGLMLNRENKITLGYKKKRQLIAAISSYVMDRKNGIRWDLHELQALNGNINYHKMVEGDSIEGVIDFLSKKFGVNINRMMKEDLSV